MSEVNGSVEDRVVRTWEYINKKRKEGWGKAALAIVVGLLGFGFAEKVVEDNTQFSIPGFFSKQAKTDDFCMYNSRGEKVTATGIEKPQLPEATRTMTVQSAGRTKDGSLLFLNDNLDWKSPATFTIMVSNIDAFPQLKGISNGQLKGKVVTATGQLDQYNGRNELKVSEPGKLSIKW